MLMICFASGENELTKSQMIEWGNAGEGGTKATLSQNKDTTLLAKLPGWFHGSTFFANISTALKFSFRVNSEMKRGFIGVAVRPHLVHLQSTFIIDFLKFELQRISNCVRVCLHEYIIHCTSVRNGESGGIHIPFLVDIVPWMEAMNCEAN